MCVKSTGTMGCIDFVLPGCISTRPLALFRENQQHASKPDLEALLDFLNFALAKCTDLNTTASVYKECLSCFMSEAIWRYVENLDGIDPTSQTHHLSLKSMYVGAHVSLCLTQDIYKEQSRVFRNCSLLEVCPVSKDLTNLCVVFFFHFSMSPR